MEEKEYLRQLIHLSPRRKNSIITAVTCKTPAVELQLETEVEQTFYQRLWSEAEAHLEKYGSWPIFDLYELDW